MFFHIFLGNIKNLGCVYICSLGYYPNPCVMHVFMLEVVFFIHVKYLQLEQTSLILRNVISGYDGCPWCWKINQLWRLTTAVRVVGQIYHD